MKTTFPCVEDYIEVIAGLRDINGIKVPFLATNPHPTVSLARYDVNIVNSFASQTDAGTSFTDRQSELALKLIEKYRRQLYGLGIDVEPILANIKFRMPVRVVDRSKSIRIEDGMMIMRFPYDKVLVPEVTKASKESRGTFAFDAERKVWRLALTEYNVNWAKSFGQAKEFELDPEIDRLMNLILECEKTDYGIELTVDSDNNIVITNAEPSLLDHIARHIGPLNYSNLIKLVDASANLGYTVNKDILEAVNRGFSTVIAGLIKNRESHIKRADAGADVVEAMTPVIEYATLTNRWPICIYEPDLSDKLYKHALAVFEPGEILKPNSAMGSHEVDLAGVKCIYFSKLKYSWIREWFGRIPVLISTNAMLYGIEKQAMLQLAEKVVYYTPTVLDKKVKEIGSTTNN